MREAFFLFRKDVRHFRLQLGAFLALMGLLGCAEAKAPRRPEWLAAGLVCQWMLVPAAWYLLVLTVHEQKLPGDRQYWLTRPYPRRSLLLAKALFVAAFLNLPLLATEIATLAANGLSPLVYWRALAARQFFFTALMVLPPAALATVTASLAQFAMGAFAGFGAVLLIELGGGHAPGQWGGLEWIEFTGVAVLALAIFGGVVLLQYTRRKTLWAAALWAAGVVVCAGLPVMDFWSAGFALQKRLSARAGEASAVRLQFDAARDPAGVAGFPRPVDHPELAPLALPVQLTGIPEGMALLAERTAAALEAPGVSWDSGWQPPLAEPRALRTSGSFWQVLAVDREILDTVKDRPVRLRIRAAFTLLGAPATTRLPVPAEDRWVPDVGFCRTSPARVTCLAPFSHAAWVEGEARPAPPASPEPLPLRPEISYAPFPTGAGFGLWQADLDAMWIRAMPWKEIAIQTRPALAHFELALDIPEIRLARYSGAAGGARP